MGRISGNVVNMQYCKSGCSGTNYIFRLFIVKQALLFSLYVRVESDPLYNEVYTASYNLGTGPRLYEFLDDTLSCITNFYHSNISIVLESYNADVSISIISFYKVGAC